MEDSTVQAAIVPALLASGFPFQTLVAQIIRECKGWSVAAEELPWMDRMGGDQFLDIVADSHRICAGIECKKTKKEGMVFLLPGESQSSESFECSTFHLLTVNDSTKRLEVSLGRWIVPPKSPVSKFCVICNRGNGASGRLLERDVQLLIRGTLAFGFREKQRLGQWNRPEAVPLVSILVTNAPIWTAAYDPRLVNQATGEIDVKALTLREVGYVRFSKPFMSSERVDLGELTCFVVSIGALTGFLEDLAKCNPSLDRGSGLHLKP